MYLLQHLGGGLAVEQIHLHGMQFRAVPGRGLDVQGHHFAALRQQLFAHSTANASTAATDQGHLAQARCGCDAQAACSTKAKTRKGLPLPFWIFKGGLKIRAPVGGNWSKLAKHCKP